jgi:metal transporter CNNM
VFVLLEFVGCPISRNAFASLRLLHLEIESDDPVSAAYARRIYPIRKNGNLLLCTLLLGNTSANSLLSILVADKFGGIVGVLASTFLVLLFGEIIPQAVCNRYALYIGSHAIPLVRCIIVLFYPIAKPLAFVLDLALGEELATTYSAKEMQKLLQIHVAENAIDHETANAMTGALKYKDVAVSAVMTPIENVFMLKSDEKLNYETIARIFKTGYSRIPVYEVNKVRVVRAIEAAVFRDSSNLSLFQNNVVGLLFVKDLIFIDPGDETRVSDFIDIFGRGVHVVWPDDKLGDVLRELKLGRSHMALVRDVNKEDDSQDPFYEVRGIITLEDIIEEILGKSTPQC